MKWLKDNWYWFFMVFVFTISAGLMWLSKENGDYHAWAMKPLSQATLGDAASLLFMVVFLQGLFRK